MGLTAKWTGERYWKQQNDKAQLYMRRVMPDDVLTKVWPNFLNGSCGQT